MRILILIIKLLELVAQGVCVDDAQGEGGLGGELKIGLASKVHIFTPNFSFSRRKKHALDHLSVQLIFQNSCFLYLCALLQVVDAPCGEKNSIIRDGLVEKNLFDTFPICNIVHFDL